MGAPWVRVGVAESEKQPGHIVVVFGRRRGAVRHPIEDVGIGAVEQGLVAVELSRVEARKMGVSKAAEDQVGLARAAVPGSEQQPLAADFW